MKKTMRWIVLLLFILSLAAPAFAAGEGVRITGEANVRSTPNLTGAVLGVAHPDSEYKFYGSSGNVATDERGVDWYHINFGGQSGWVSSKYAAPVSGGSGASKSVSLTGDANIRKGPGLDYGAVSGAKSGATLPYLGESSVDDRGVTWYKVQTDSGAGWVSSKFAVLQSGGGSSSSSSGASAAVTVSDDANIRKGPGTGYDVLTGAKAGKELPYLGESYVDERGVTWYKVQAGGYAGWISSKVGALHFAADAPLEELSTYYLTDLKQAAQALSLNNFEEVVSEVPNQYTNGLARIAGDDVVEFIAVTGPGYTVYGVGVGMDRETAKQLLEDAGLKYEPAFSEDSLYFQHPSSPESLYDADGYDGGIIVDFENDIVVEVSWSSYTG